MSLPGLVPGLPRIGARVNAVPNIIFRGGYMAVRAGGNIIDGSLCRDLGNGTDTNVLRCGVIMGKVTTGGKYANSIIGVTSGAYSGGTSLSASAAVITEIIRRNGTSGTLTIVGPSTAAGTLGMETITYSAASGTTLTITALSNNYIAGSFIMPADGSQGMLFPIVDAYGIQVTDIDNLTNLSVPVAEVPYAGEIITANLINWPSDTSLQSFVMNSLGQPGRGHFTFDAHY